MQSKKLNSEIRIIQQTVKIKIINDDRNIFLFWSALLWKYEQTLQNQQ
jgi:hypothetical protein